MLKATERLVLRPDSHLRPPAWRWELARLLVGNLPTPDRYSTPVHHHDPEVESAARTLQLLEKPGIDEDERLDNFGAIHPHQADAYVFYDSAVFAAVTDPVLPAGSGESHPMVGPLTAEAISRAQLDALILAGKSPDRIANIMGLPEAVVTQYESWWFDVRDRLKHKGWVAAKVIGSLLQGPPALILPALIRAYGYHTKDSRIVNRVVSMFDSKTTRNMARDPVTFFSKDAVAAGGLKAALAVRLMPLGSKTYAQVMELHHDAMEIAAKSGQGAASESEEMYRGAAHSIFGRIEHGHRMAPVEVVPELQAPRLVIPAEETG